MSLISLINFNYAQRSEYYVCIYRCIHCINILLFFLHTIFTKLHSDIYISIHRIDGSFSQANETTRKIIE